MYLKLKLEIYTHSEEETRALGKRLGKAAYGGLAITFSGGLGMGKTKFIQGIGDALGIKRVKSPTFIIVDEHESTPPLIHADLYRLEDTGDIASLDLEHYLDEGCLLAVEWAEYWKNRPNENIICITFEKTGENSRKITFEATGKNAVQILEQLKTGEQKC